MRKHGIGTRLLIEEQWASVIGNINASIEYQGTFHTTHAPRTHNVPIQIKAFYKGALMRPNSPLIVVLYGNVTFSHGKTTRTVVLDVILDNL